MHPQIHALFDGLAILTLGIGAHLRLRWHPAYSIELLLNGLVTAIWTGIFVAWLPNIITPLHAILLSETVPPNWWRAGLDNWMLAVAGAALAGYLFMRRRNLPILLVFDAFAPLAAIALAVIRVGCAVNGDSYGKITDSWVAMRLPDVSGVYAWRYPTQYVSLIMNLLIAGFLMGFEWIASHRWRKPRGWPFSGFLFWMYVALYCTQRFYFEFWRGDKPYIFGSYTVTHIYCIIGLTVAAWRLWRGWQQAHLESETNES